MTALFQFSAVACAGLERSYSFTLDARAARVLRVPSAAEKDALIEVALGNRICRSGGVQLHGVPLEECRLGSIGWVAAQGGLISNLKVWENVTLPLWYHGKASAVVAEQRIARWLSVLGLEPSEWEVFMATPPDRLALWQQKLAGLLRGLVQLPAVLVVDAGLLDHVGPRLVAAWTDALEEYAAEQHAVLAVAAGATALPWNRIE